MRYASLALLLLLPSAVFGAEYFEQSESEVYQTTGTVKDISLKAKSCIAQIVKSGAVRIGDSASAENLEGSQLFLDVNVDSGTITANSNVDYSKMLIPHNVKSTLTFLVKEDRFKIRHSNIEYVQKETGSIRNSGYSRVGKWWGSGWKDAEKALAGVSDKVAKCVQGETKKEDW